MMRFPTNVALSEVPVNVTQLIDDTDFKSVETAVAYNAAGMDLVWNFMAADGSFTQTAVTPTSGGSYDWTHQGKGFYTIEMPATGGASINNNQAGVGWFSGSATGVLPWTGPQMEFVPGGSITSGTPSTTAFVSSHLSAAVTDFYVDAFVVFLTGACAGCGPKKITAFNHTTDTVTCEALPTAPAVNDIFYLVTGA